MHIPKRFANASIYDWEQENPVRGLIDEYLGNFHEHYEAGKAPFLVGKAGAGKTHCAAAIYNAILNGANESLELAWFSASEVFNQMLDAKDLYMKDIYVSLKSKLRSADLIVLDDISALRNYSRLIEAFWGIMEYRYGEMKPTLLTANFDIVDEDLWGSLSNAFTPAISRRVKEGSSGLTLLF